MLSGNPKLFELVEMLRQNELLEAIQAELDRNYVRPVGDIVQGPYAIHVPRVRPEQVIRDTVTTLVEKARLGMVPDRMV